MMKAILVIDDKQAELDRAEAAVLAVLGETHCVPILCKCWHEACLYLDLYDEADQISGCGYKCGRNSHYEVVGVLTDWNFPLHTGGREQAMGVDVIIECHLKGIPCVVCTSGHHNFDSERQAKRLGAEVVNKKDIDPDAWTKAMAALKQKLPNITK